jgi:hypothetical protein
MSNAMQRIISLDAEKKISEKQSILMPPLLQSLICGLLLNNCQSQNNILALSKIAITPSRAIGEAYTKASTTMTRAPNNLNKPFAYPSLEKIQLHMHQSLNNRTI